MEVFYKTVCRCPVSLLNDTEGLRDTELQGPLQTGGAIKEGLQSLEMREWIAGETSKGTLACLGGRARLCGLADTLWSQVGQHLAETGLGGICF